MIWEDDRESVPWPESGQMSIAHVAGKNPLAPEERNVLSTNPNYFAPPKLWTSLGSWFL